MNGVEFLPLGEKQPIDVGGDLSDVRVGARRGDTVAVRRARRAADEMIVFVGRHHEERVVFGDAVGSEPGEEFPECGIV